MRTKRRPRLPRAGHELLPASRAGVQQVPPRPDGGPLLLRDAAGGAQVVGPPDCADRTPEIARLLGAASR